MIKVAGYCRVSTDKEDQANSFEAQQHFFREYIQRQPNWELYAIYADEGITGTSTKKRYQFNRMIQDGINGKFQLIITKEVSRFSRNILDTIKYTRELKAAGIGVIFMTDGISTLEPDAELRLSIMSSIAQEESRRTSSRVVWGQTRQMEKGIVFGHSLLGYDVKNGKITINRDGAEIVRIIFEKYALEQMRTSEIAAYLTQHGYTTASGRTCWNSGSIIKILKNEKYVGDLIQKKTYTPDFLTHEKKRNTGEQPFIAIRNHHTPIISREIWEKAQARLQQNNKHNGKMVGHSNRYLFSGKIRCGECGATFVCRTRTLADGTKKRRWCCATSLRRGCNACSVGTLVRDEDAMQMLRQALRSLQLDTEAIVCRFTCWILEVGEEDTTDRLQQKIERIQNKKAAMMDSYFSGEITKEEMLTMKQKYHAQMANLQNRLQKVTAPKPEYADLIRSEINAVISGTASTEAIYKVLLKELTVYKDKHVELKLKHLSQVFYFANASNKTAI